MVLKGARERRIFSLVLPAQTWLQAVYKGLLFSVPNPEESTLPRAQDSSDKGWAGGSIGNTLMFFGFISDGACANFRHSLRVFSVHCIVIKGSPKWPSQKAPPSLTHS